MKNLLITLCCLLPTATLLATDISGTVTDHSGEALPGVNVYIQDSYDGATTDLNGLFHFSTSQEGAPVLIISFIGYKTQELHLDLTQTNNLSIVLKEEVSRLSGVTITAGSFEASDEKKAVILKPLDIAMTAGATGDIAGALNMLPGTTTNGESGRLFVRGGTSEETKAFIDGMAVQNFYNSTAPTIPSRSRFSPFLFKGTFFSAGGYSAEYGQALSSVLSLTSTDIPDQTRSDFSIMSVGLDASHTQKWKNGSLFGQIQYMNLTPYNGLVKQKYDWTQPPVAKEGTFMWRQKIGKNDLLKVYGNWGRNTYELKIPSASTGTTQQTNSINDNTYVNTSYQKAIKENSTIFLGMSTGHNANLIELPEVSVEDIQNQLHLKGYFTTDLSNLSIKFGAEQITSSQDQNIKYDPQENNTSDYHNTLTASFLETDYYISNQWTVRAGIRYSYSSLLDETSLSPRLSTAFKVSEYAQFSMAYGKFHQLPTSDILLNTQSLTAEKSDHYLLNFQITKNQRTFRGEIYYKRYENLVKYGLDENQRSFNHSNAGQGYARGIDLFLRDSKSIPNGDFWISYSLIDTEREFKDYPTQAAPSFAAKHNLSVVYRQFFPAIKTQIGASYAHNSGRPYNNPNQDQFNQSTTKHFSNLSFNLAYLFKPTVIIYASATNLLGRENVFGYQYTSQPNESNQFEALAVTPPAIRFLFISIFITLTKDKKTNNLENL